MRRTFRARLRRPGGTGRQDSLDESEIVEIDSAELTGIFSAPQWLRDFGIASWLLVGVAAFLAGLIWLLALTQTIVIPVLVAAIIASVLSPVVDWLQGKGLPRAAGTVIVFLAVVAVGIGIGVMIVTGITNETSAITSELRSAADELSATLQDAGVDGATAESAKQDVSNSLSDGFDALISGVSAGISALAGLAVFLSFTLLSLFLMLKDAPEIGGWIRRHMRVPEPVARTILARTAKSLRGYFLGMTIVSIFSSVIVFAGAVLLGVDLPGVIAVVTFIGGFIPYLGAWAAGAFAVLIALGSTGPEAAAALAVVVLLANGVLQQIVQPIAYGATLGIHPLAVLIVTIAGGAMFGTIGLILASPVVSAAVHISEDLRRAQELAASDEPAGDPSPSANTLATPEPT